MIYHELGIQLRSVFLLKEYGPVELLLYYDAPGLWETVYRSNKVSDLIFNYFHFCRNHINFHTNRQPILIEVLKASK